MGDRSFQKDIQWLPFVNVSRETIPAHSCIQLQLEGNEDQRTPSGRTVFRGAKPDGFGAQFHHRLTWMQATEPGKVGYCQLPVMVPMLAAFDGTANKPTAGDLIGPTNGFKLKKDVGGFRVIGYPKGGANNKSACLVIFEPCLSLKVKLTEDLESGETATANPYAGAEVLTSLEISIREDLGISTAISVGTDVRCQWDTHYQDWIAIAAACAE